MTRKEALDVVGMVLSHWHSSKEWTKEEIDAYARLIQDLDVELTMSALIRAAKEVPYRPSVSELRQRVLAERKRLAPSVAPKETKGQPIPLWVKRWICARMLFAQFDKERDDRRFPEQLQWGDQTREVMPEGAWEKEAHSLSDRDIRKAWTTSVA